MYYHWYNNSCARLYLGPEHYAQTTYHKDPGPQLLTFETQYPYTDSPDWSPYISLQNVLKEFDERSSFPYMITLLILQTFSFDYVLILLGD